MEQMGVTNSCREYTKPRLGTKAEPKGVTGDNQIGPIRDILVTKNRMVVGAPRS